MINTIKKLFHSKDKLSFHEKTIRAVDNMKATRFWALWVIGIVFVLAVFVQAAAPLIRAIAPEGLYTPRLVNVAAKS